MATENKESAEPDIQKQNAVNRSKVLSFWTLIKNKNVEIRMINGTKVNGIFLGTKSDQSQLLIKQLKTPIGTYPYTILRQSDISYIKCL